jgi:hypothetical protein
MVISLVADGHIVLVDGYIFCFERRPTALNWPVAVGVVVQCFV